MKNKSKYTKNQLEIFIETRISFSRLREVYQPLQYTTCSSDLSERTASTRRRAEARQLSAGPAAPAVASVWNVLLLELAQSETLRLRLDSSG